MIDLQLLMNLVILAALIWFAEKRGARFLHFFQQEDYDGGRFFKWLIVKFAMDRRITLPALLYFPLLAAEIRLVNQIPPVAGHMLYIAINAYPWLLAPAIVRAAMKEPDPTQNTKKPLVWTPRAKRIFRLFLVLAAVAAVPVTIPSVFTMWSNHTFGGARYIAALVTWVQILPLWLIVANIMLWPVERAAQLRYYAEAKLRIAQLKPTVIGITGSYGKTSVKHILAHILSGTAPTLMTPASVNTLMGVTRVIREDLKPEHKFFIVEMGAYKIGSIARLCQLTPPTLAAITAVGPAHYERFKEITQVARAKFEIATATWRQKNSLVVLNTTQIDARSISEHLRHPDQTELVTNIANPGSYSIGDIVQTSHGLNFRLTMPEGETVQVETPLFGKQHAANIAVAVALAVAAGVQLTNILQALKTMPQIPSRSEIKRMTNQPVMIDDASSSNPTGFAAALEVLDHLGRDSIGRRVLVTPGMTELGKLHKTEHSRLGALAAQKADWIIVVAPRRIPTFVAAARKGGGVARVDTVPTLAAARRLLRGADLSGRDIVLYENDLPELYESSPRF